MDLFWVAYLSLTKYLIFMRKENLIFKFLFGFAFVFCIPCSVLYAQNTTIDNMQADTLKKASGVPEVQLLFNTKMPKRLTVSSSAAVYNQDLIKMPVSNVLNALTGRLSGLLTNQQSGQPGSDAVSVSLRGQSPLIIIDGVPRDITTIDLEEIESVTVLKDAVATAMLGVRGAKGALLITTRKGSRGKQQISFTAQTAFQKPLFMPKALNAFQYGTLRNEAVANEALVGNDFASLKFSGADLQAFKDGSDPIGHPDVDWRKEVLEPTTKFDRYSLNANGGSDMARYYVGIEHFNQEGMLKTYGANKYDTNNSLKSYLIRSNVDLNINRNLSGGIHLFGRILNGNEPGAGVSNIFSSFLTTPATAYPVRNVNGSFAGVQQYQNNILAQSIGSGYKTSYRRDILADFNLKLKLDAILKGLWVKGLISYSANLTENLDRSKPVITFQQNGSGYTQYGVVTDQLNTNSIAVQGRQNYLEFSLGYNHQSGLHGFDMLILGNRDNAVVNADIPFTITGTSGHFSYNYDERYLAEIVYGINGANRYAPNGATKYGVFPAAGLGWNIHKEAFLQETTWLNELKLFGSFGVTGNENSGYFSYIQRINGGTTAYFGSSAGATSTSVEGTLANPDLTYEKAYKLNLGLSSRFFKNRLSFTAEYYRMKYTDLVMQRGKNTALLGNTYPNENIGQNRYTGWEFDLSWQDHIGNFGYFISGNASLQDSKVLFMDEVNQPYPWMSKTGQRVGQAFGYVSDGLFESQSEINSRAKILGYVAQPGDVKYLDLNGDGVINQLDQTAIGSDKPNIFFGLNLGFNFKGFDFSALIQGVTNRYLNLSGNGYYEFQNSGFGNAYEQHLERYTASNTNASYPRLSIGNNTNNQAFSSYWYRKANYVRLKSTELGYTIPGKYSSFLKLQSVRIFANAMNLFTLSSLKDMDPEVNLGNYPIQRVFNFGINVKL